MKKLMIAASAALCAAVSFGVGIESANIVGYQTTSSPAAGKYVALAVQFENIGETIQIPIADLLTVADAKGANAIAATADQIWLWDTTAGDWVKYFYRVNRGTVVGWCKSGAQAVTTDTIGAGVTFFFYRGNSGSVTTITTRGQIKPFEATPTYSIEPAKYTFMAYPWPVALPIDGLQKYCSNAKGANAIAATADQVWLWDTTAGDWVKYFYRVNRGTVIGWCKSGEQTATTDTIPAGEGFFFYHGNAGVTGDTVTFTYGD